MQYKSVMFWVVLLAVMPANAVLGEWTNVGTGIDYQEFTTGDPNNLFVARMDRTQSSAFLETTIGQGTTSGGTEIVRSQASRYDDAIGYWGQTWGVRNDVVVAINGSFYNTTTGVPTSGMIHSGSYCKRFDNVTGGSGFAYTLNAVPFIGECVTHYSFKQFVTYDDASTQNFQGINVAPADGELTIFTPEYDDSTGTASTVSEVVVQLTTPFLIKPTPATITGTVVEIRQNQGDASIPFDCIVLSAEGSAETTLLSKVSLNDTIYVSQEIKTFEADCSTALAVDFTKTYASLSGSYYFLKNNVVQTFTDEGANIRNPRTAIAYDADYIFFVVCDGRDAGTSVGMTMTELGNFCKNTLGATYGINQDGGGSSTMVVNGTLENNPSDGSERAVSNGFLMCNLASKTQSTTLETDDLVQTTTSTNLLLGPGDNYAALTTLSSSAQGTVESHSLNGLYAKGAYWWKVDFSGTVGWVDESDITEITAPTTCHVDDVVASAVNVGSGYRKGRATVTIKDNNGSVVSGATVYGTFTGDYSESGSATTNASGVAVIETTSTKKGTPDFTFCVTNVTHATLTYSSGDNVVTCDSY